ncbi:MAG: hypothetical protein HZC42_03710 [Candidatus Eisenbacteria bacterium]|nr:hypothetical protein [Candidatus Eisenbacteria bacterium]
MTDSRMARERVAWIAVVAVLATSLAWLAVIDLVLLAGAYGHRLPEVFVVARALLRAGRLLVTQGWPGTPAALIVWTGLGAVALAARPGALSRSGLGHA